MNTYTPREFSKLTNIPQRILITLSKSGTLTPFVNDENKKFYTDVHLQQCRDLGLSKENTRVKVYRTEVRLTEKQQHLFRKSLGVLRFVYNLFIETNTKSYKNRDKNDNKSTYKNNMDFSKWLNNEYLPNNQDKLWIKEVSSKAIRNIIDNAHQAYIAYIKNIIDISNKVKNHKKVKRDKNGKVIYPDPPKFKKKFVDEPSIYFIKDGVQVERHKVKIPVFGWIYTKEKGYLPKDAEVISGNLKLHAGRIFISLRVREKIDNLIFTPLTDGIGVDLGIKHTVITSDGRKFENINKTREIRRLEKLSKRLDRKISRQRDDWKKRTQKEDNPTKNRLNKSYERRQRINARLTNIRDDYNSKIVMELVRAKPEYITIEDLNISGMMKNRHLSKAISDQKLYSLRQKLTRKCQEIGIEVRIVDRFYPSSKTCHNCGCIKSDLKLKDRTFICPDCGYSEDRDINASLNLRDARNFKVA